MYAIRSYYASSDTPFFPDPLRIARELGLTEYIITPGWIAEEDRPLLYAAATVFVFPSRYEGRITSYNVCYTKLLRASRLA